MLWRWEMAEGMIPTAPSFPYTYHTKGEYTLELKEIQRGLIVLIGDKKLKIKDQTQVDPLHLSSILLGPLLESKLFKPQRVNGVIFVIIPFYLKELQYLNKFYLRF